MVFVVVVVLVGEKDYRYFHPWEFDSLDHVITHQGRIGTCQSLEFEAISVLLGSDGPKVGKGWTMIPYQVYIVSSCSVHNPLRYKNPVLTQFTTSFLSVVESSSYLFKWCKETLSVKRNT